MERVQEQGRSEHKTASDADFKICFCFDGIEN